MLLVGGVMLSGCQQAAEETTPDTEETTLRREDYPKLESQLFDLATAADPAAYADRHNLTYEAGKAQATLVLRDPQWTGDLKWAVRALDGEVAMSSAQFIEVRVPIPALLDLAQHPRIQAVRGPMQKWPE